MVTTCLERHSHANGPRLHGPHKLAACIQLPLPVTRQRTSAPATTRCDWLAITAAASTARALGRDEAGGWRLDKLVSRRRSFAQKWPARRFFDFCDFPVARRRSIASWPRGQGLLQFLRFRSPV